MEEEEDDDDDDVEWCLSPWRLGMMSRFLSISSRSGSSGPNHKVTNDASTSVAMIGYKYSLGPTKGRIETVST